MNEIQCLKIGSLRTLSRASRLFFSSKYSCSICCEHLRHLQEKNATFRHQSRFKTKIQKPYKPFNILGVTEAEEGNTSIFQSRSPNTVKEKSKQVFSC